MPQQEKDKARRHTYYKEHCLALIDFPKAPVNKSRMTAIAYASAMECLVYAIVHIRSDLDWVDGLPN